MHQEPAGGFLDEYIGGDQRALADQFVTGHETNIVGEEMRLGPLTGNLGLAGAGENIGPALHHRVMPLQRGPTRMDTDHRRLARPNPRQGLPVTCGKRHIERVNG